MECYHSSSVYTLAGRYSILLHLALNIKVVEKHITCVFWHLMFNYLIFLKFNIILNLYFILH